MRQRTTRALCLLLALAMVFSLFACSSATIRIDESGRASWDRIKNAVQYEYVIADREASSMGSQFTTETTVQLPEGRCIHMRPIFADGSTGNWIVSDFYGTPGLWSDDESEPIDEPDSPTSDVTLDAEGYASWESIEGAVRYECSFSDSSYTNVGDPVFTKETSIRVPAGCQVYVRAVFADGSTGHWLTSDFFGEAAEAVDGADYIDGNFDLCWDQVKTWNLVENIDHSTVQQTADGGVAFSAAAPDGSEMRFVGTAGVTVSEGAITFSAGSRLFALDAIGRICAYEPVISDFGEGRVDIIYTGGYTFNGATSVDSVDDLFQVWGSSGVTEDMKNGSFALPVMEVQPNMVGIGAGNYLEQDDYTLSELIVYYDEATYATPIGELRLDYMQYGSYLEGELYDPAKEVYDSSAAIYTFYLMVVPKLLNENEPLPDFMLDSMKYMARSVIGLPQTRYTIGNLKDASGNILDKSTAALSVGCTLEVTICGTTYDLELPILGRVQGAQLLSELAPYSNSASIGDITTLVVPIRWSDLPQEANDDTLNLIRAKVGRVVDASGSVTDYSPDPSEGYSLSAYYDAASYGTYRIESFITDWIDASCPFEQVRDLNPLDTFIPDELLSAVCEMYPDMDWSKFDRNSDGILDSVIFISASGDQAAEIFSFAGAAHHNRSMTNNCAGTPSQPKINSFICIGNGMLGRKNVVIHEHAHNLGIVDYYDVTYSGIDAVGGYDMQSQSHGDWNAYSKYAVGWIDPKVVTGLASGESVDITIGAMSETGDAIVIPAAGSEFDGPFDEYMLVDLFADCGVHQYDAAFFGLAGVTGVRIYHVNSNMECRTLTDFYGDPFDIGTIHYSNSANDNGKYLIELLQKGGKNTFTNPKNTNTNASSQDFFYAGDSFDAEDYGEFLIDGKMDDRSEFGYTIDVLSITGSGADAQAVIRITRK